MLFLLFLQAAQQAPDIQLQANVQARSVRIEREGEAELKVHAEPDIGSLVEVTAPEAGKAKTLRNVNVTVDAEARIGDPGKPAPQKPGQQETSQPN